MRAILGVFLSAILTGIIIDRLAQLYDDWRETKFVPCKNCSYVTVFEDCRAKGCTGKQIDKVTKKRVDSKTCYFSEEVTIKRRLSDA